MVIDFCYDDLGQYGIGYPNLAKRNLQPDQFDNEYPRVVPLRLLLHFQNLGINSRAHLVQIAPKGAWYPVAFAWHDFGCDYIGMMSPTVQDRLRSGDIRALFYYHEGDNPQKICDHLRSRCRSHDVPETCFLLVSANSAADDIQQAVYFPDHEYFFRWINRRQQPQPPLMQQRRYQFTALNRVHKIWRAHVMADLERSGILARSLWSYHKDVTMQDADQEHPLDLCALPDWPAVTDRFLSAGPYVCDSADAELINDHSTVNEKLFTQSNCHIVLETLMDADGSGGAFLTEKTYKCIKFAQPFVIIGTPGSLACLRRDGYRTFDHVIDPQYDTITDASKRYLAIKGVLADIMEQDPLDFLKRCIPDLLHNQDVFLNHKSQGLSRLIQRLA